jgi:N-acetylgalactosamine PTS system EIIA component
MTGSAEGRPPIADRQDSGAASGDSATRLAKSVAGLLVGHGQFADGLRSALRLIVGEVPDFEYVSTEGRGRPDLQRIITEVRARFGSRPLIVFTDLFGGCGSNVCGSMLRGCSNVGIICGVNLPMLIKFAQYRDQMSFPELYDVLVRTGCEGIRAAKRPSL